MGLGALSELRARLVQTHGEALVQRLEIAAATEGAKLDHNFPDTEDIKSYFKMKRTISDNIRNSEAGRKSRKTWWVTFYEKSNTLERALLDSVSYIRDNVTELVKLSHRRSNHNLHRQGLVASSIRLALEELNKQLESFLPSEPEQETE